jgi:serine/threonine-protein kinase
MGTVWLAFHEGLKSEVVLKFMNPALQENAANVSRFVQEARLAARLRHPNVVQVYDIAESAGLLYIVMEFCPGGSVSAELRRAGCCSEARALTLMSGVARALDYAARFQIVHRDIKPDNILLSDQNDAKLADLGLARGARGETPELTQSDACMGTPTYMPPEQARAARDADARSDLYSLGATFYHLVCGRPPFGGSNTIEVLLQHATAPIPDPRTFAPHLSPAFAALLTRLLQKDPALRPQSAAALLDGLARCATPVRHVIPAPPPARPAPAVPLRPPLPEAAREGAARGAGEDPAIREAQEGLKLMRLLKKQKRNA